MSDDTRPSSEVQALLDRGLYTYPGQLGEIQKILSDHKMPDHAKIVLIYRVLYGDNWGR